MSRILRSIHSQLFVAICLLVLMTTTFIEQAQAEQTQPGVVFHISHSSQASRAMIQITRLMEGMPGVPVVIVGVADGIRFMLDGAKDKNGAPYSARIEQLIGNGVEIYACRNTLDTFELTDNDLTFGIDTVPSGIVAVSEYQLKKGYAYIKP